MKDGAETRRPGEARRYAAIAGRYEPNEKYPLTSGDASSSRAHRFAKPVVDRGGSCRRVHVCICCPGCNHRVPAMDVIFDYRIPVLHPLAVHLPVTLLLVAALAALIWMFRGTAFWRRCLLFLMLLSAPAALLAYLTGDTMKARSEGVPIIEDLVDLHERMALFTLIATTIVAITLGGYAFRVERLDGIRVDPIQVRVGVSLMIFLAAALVAWTAHIGAAMTWGVAS